jgi:hypothetical protein
MLSTKEPGVNVIIISNIVEMIENQRELADVMWIVYENSAMKFYIKEVKATLQDNRRLESKLENMCNSIMNICSGT